MSHEDPIWRRIGGEWVPVRELKLDELREARLELMQRDLADPATRMLFDAVNQAIERYRAEGGPADRAWRQAA